MVEVALQRVLIWSNSSGIRYYLLHASRFWRWVIGWWCRLTRETELPKDLSCCMRINMIKLIFLCKGDRICSRDNCSFWIAGGRRSAALGCSLFRWRRKWVLVQQRKYYEHGRGIKQRAVLNGAGTKALARSTQNCRCQELQKEPGLGGWAEKSTSDHTIVLPPLNPISQLNPSNKRHDWWSNCTKSSRTINGFGMCML
jgi:hypothetical protein